MSDFRFANPQWSVAIWIVLGVVALLLFLQHRQSGALERLMSATMQSRLVSRPPVVRRWLAVLCLGLSGICLVVALMRPQFGLTYIKSPRVGAQIMFCLDVSKSMLAEDTAPNRLERAKADISDLIRFLDGDQVGLIGFAGRAAVLCPLTPDYGFFKLILDDANPGSVGRGGTRLEEPLRKALDGFRSETDVSRIVVLITDGEDHDSHPLDVAKEAVERGIRVIAIGFGDESGSEIRMTDARTGVQSTVRDADGNPVISRLDGQLLRELALATEGVYIPAGTGNLDLESIYDIHIQPLVRGKMQTEGRAVRQDAFQWAVLAGLVFLFVAVLLGSGGANRDESDLSFESVATRLLLFICLSVCGPSIGRAEESDADSPSANPRETYNLGFRQINKNLSVAEDLLSTARQEAGTDGEVRFRATYNMGWVEVQRADKLLDEKPEEALKHLQTASGWFRDAIRLRKDDTNARHNLEIVLRRILELRDQLSNKKEKDLAAKLDELIQSQRSLTQGVRGLVDQTAASEDPNIADKYRREFEAFAVQERTMLSELQDVVEMASSEFDTLQGKSDEERSPDESVRMARLAGVMSYVNQANQRIGQTRSQLRRRQASRAFRRASAGLNELKRARDQLRNPLETLDGILADAMGTTQQTTLKSLEKKLVAGSIKQDEQPAVPSWITQEYLEDSQNNISSRTDELTSRLAAGLEYQTKSADNADNDSNENTKEGTLNPDQQAFLDQLREAMPHLQKANEAMQRASEKLQTPDYRAASEQQIDAIAALQEARERFADIRALIELAFATESEIAGVLAIAIEPAEDSEDQPVLHSQQIMEAVTENQAKNLERMTRLETKVKDRLQTLASESGNDDAEPSPEQQQLQVATQLIQLAKQHMKSVSDNLPDEQESGPKVQPKDDANSSEETADDQKTKDDPQAESDANEPKSDSEPRSDSETKSDANSDSEPKPDTNSESDTSESTPDEQVGPFAVSKKAADQSVETLMELRRLFFSVLEHLQDTARQQSQLNDDTEQAAGNQSESQGEPGDDEKDLASVQQQAQKLRAKQEELAQMSKQISGALQQQALQSSEQPEGSPQLNPQQQAQLQQNAEKAKRASELVQQAREKMDAARDELSAEEPALADSRPFQDDALTKLIEAIQELQPPQQNQDQQQDQQSDQQQNQNQESDQSEQNEPQNQQQAGSSDDQNQEANDDQKMDPSRVLQAVRDREAQRRRDKNQRQTAGHIPVEKDW